MSLTILNLLFTAPLLIVGVLAARWDLKKGIIPNRFLFAGYLWAAVVYLTLLFLNIFYLRSGELFSYLPEAILNGLISVSIGYVFWKFNFWSAGDGKLFGLYGLLLPLEYYSDFYINYFPGVSLLVNLFVPLIFLILAKILITARKERREIADFLKSFNLTEEKLKSYGIFSGIFLSNIALALIFIRFLITGFENWLAVEPEPILILVLFLAFMITIHKLMRKFSILRFFKYAAILSFLGYFAARGEFVLLVGFLQTILVFALFLGVLRYLLLFYVKKRETRKVKAKDVKKGMVPTKEWRRYLSKRVSELDREEYVEAFQNLSAGGLTARQAEIIRDLFESDDKYVLEVVKSIPFAPFMLLAGIISIITSSSFSPWISELVNFLVQL